jgi:hypothetical protein
MWSTLWYRPLCAEAKTTAWPVGYLRYAFLDGALVVGAGVFAGVGDFAGAGAGTYAPPPFPPVDGFEVAGFGMGP